MVVYSSPEYYLNRNSTKSTMVAACVQKAETCKKGTPRRKIRKKDERDMKIKAPSGVEYQAIVLAKLGGDNRRQGEMEISVEEN